MHYKFLYGLKGYAQAKAFYPQPNTNAMKKTTCCVEPFLSYLPPKQQVKTVLEATKEAAVV